MKTILANDVVNHDGVHEVMNIVCMMKDWLKRRSASGFPIAIMLLIILPTTPTKQAAGQKFQAAIEIFGFEEVT
jgi:hypothetical protein